MFENDSLNDSCETFNLYSSKKVTDTYNTQLLELINNKNSVLEGNESIIEDKNVEVSNKNECDLKLVDNSERANENNSIISNSDVVELSDCSIDNSIEILNEVDEPGVRRSLRLRNRQRRCNRRTCNSEVNSNDKSPVLPSKSKKKGNRKKGRQLDVEEVVINESLKETKEDMDGELNPEVSVKIIWKSVKIKKFLVRRFQKISKIYQELSKEENVPESQILLTFKSAKINPTDTPASLNLQIFDFLEGGILSEATNPESERVASSEIHYDSGDTIMLKFQDCNKKSVKISLNKSDKMKVGMIKYSEQAEIPLENIKYFFDGELLDPCETPQTLGLEGDEVIDVKIVR